MASQPDFETVYRIVSRDYPPFDGSGAYRFGSRWVSPERLVIHAAASYSLAVLENLVHWQSGRLPESLVYVSAQIPDAMEQEYLPAADLPHAASGDYRRFREWGDDWFDRAETAVLWVPSLISPTEWNVLINQEHKDFERIVVSKPRVPHLDPRLFRANNH